MKQHLIQFWYELKLAFRSMSRHLLLSLSAMSAVMIALLLSAILIALELHMNSFITNAADRMNIHVILETDLGSSEISQIQQELEALDGVEGTEFSDKDNELELLIQEKGDAFAMYRGEENPLADAFFVFPENGTDIAALSGQIEQLEGVEAVAYGGSAARNFLKLLSRLRLGSWIIVLLLLFLSLYLIYNAVRTAIDTRKTEIQIMKTVGATESFIRIPFQMEGICIGLGGALIPFLLILWGYPLLYSALGGRLFANVFSLLPPSEMTGMEALFLFGTGILLGFLASTMAVRRYLRETR